jgi:ABC-type transport system involved in multi-copper enzyme maturation permease subunit
MFAEMKMLLWKDYRLSRLILIVGVILVAGPYLMKFFERWIHYEYNVAWVFSIFISQFTMGLLAGNIIACERIDRSAEFLSFQGASRKMLAASKLILCFLVFSVIFIINVILSLWITPSFDFPEGSREVGLVLMLSISTGVCMFGCSWFLSSMPLSPVPAIIFGSIIPIFVIWALAIISYYFQWPDKNNVHLTYDAICIGLGILSLFAGTWHYIRTKEA